MSNKLIRKEIDLAGRKLTLETGELAGHAAGSILATYGETVVLATAVSKPMSQDFGFFPLSVDYEERLYAGGRISTSRFIKREGRPPEKSILTSRLIDRSIRPLFPKDYLAEVQVIATVLSYDGENDPDVVALIAASAALTISNIPWNGPLSGLRIGRQNGEQILNPIEEEREFLNMELLLATSRDEIVMIEAEGKEIEEKAITEGFKFALQEGQKVINLIEEMVKEVGTVKQAYEPATLEPETEKAVKEYIQNEIMKDFDKNSQDENWFGDTMDVLKTQFIKEDSEEKVSPNLLAALLEDAVAQKLREEILTNHKRPDGRAPDEIRPITIKVPVLPRTHGSAIFQRGDTQVLSVATLASPALEQLIEGISGEETKRYMHHYNFPPFSTGEVKRLGSPGRREIGHGALAEKALVPVIPPTDVFPYTIRVVSEVLTSAGSTSMASACGSTLALMDAGVPIKEPVAGISVGLITDKADKSKCVLLTDIAYQEDAQGDMDFKVAGTKNGVTAIQMDTKLAGISLEVAESALQKAKIARLTILEKINEAIPAYREEISKHAPTVMLVKIEPSKIGEVIGSGGRTINSIISATGAAIDVKDDGTITVSSKDAEAAKKAAAWIEGIVKEPQPGEVYEGPVKRILPFGAMVEIMPGKEGLVHISRLAPYHVAKVEDIVKVGDVVKVNVAEIDDMGRANLSMLFGDDAKAAQQQRHQRPDRPERRFDKRGPRRQKRY